MALLIGGFGYHQHLAGNQTRSAEEAKPSAAERERCLISLETVCGPRNSDGRFTMVVNDLRYLSRSIPSGLESVPVETDGQLVRSLQDPSRWWLSGIHLNCAAELAGPALELHPDCKPWLQRELDWHHVTGRLQPSHSGPGSRMLLVVDAWIPASRPPKMSALESRAQRP
jgi:hypothetical protein